jgi:hypothetical protein
MKFFLINSMGPLLSKIKKKKKKKIEIYGNSA